MRSTFFGTGLFVLSWGSLFLLTQQVEIHPRHAFDSLGGWWTTWDSGQAVFHPPEWAAFSLLMAGFLLMLYAIGLPEPRKNRECDNPASSREGLDAPYYGRLTQSLLRVRATSKPLSRRQC